jgi:large subunit ribosomal protein L33
MSQDRLIKLKSTKSKHMYWSRKKKKADKPEKLKLKKFDPIVRQHVMYEESKK